MTIQTENTKAAAWDLIGSLFWETGRTTAKPSDEEIGLFLAGITAGTRCTVVGASTKDLVEALIALGADVTVMDFSERMCEDLRAALPEGSCRILRHDITQRAPRSCAERSSSSSTTAWSTASARTRRAAGWKACWTCSRTAVSCGPPSSSACTRWTSG